MASSTAGGGLLSTPLLATIAGGTMILLAGTSIVLYCCVRRANRPNKQMPKEILRVISPLAAHEKRQQATSPPPVSDFSPPSPHWKPAPPSIALIMQKNDPHDCRSIAPGLGYATENSILPGSRRDMPPPLLPVQQRPTKIRPPPVPPFPTQSRARMLRNAPIATDPQYQLKNTALLSNTKDRRSGLGISTINLDLRSNITSQGSQIDAFGEPPLPPKDGPIDETLVNEPIGKNSITRPQDRSSVYLAYDDVKLAYAASISSLISEKDERILSMKRRRDVKPVVKLMDEKDVQMPAGPLVFITTSYNPSGEIACPALNTASGRGNQGSHEAIKWYVNTFHRRAN